MNQSLRVFCRLLWLICGAVAVSAADVSTSSSDPQHEAAVALYRTGKVREAQKAWAELLKTRPDYLPAVINHGVASLDLDDLVVAEQDFQYALRLGADSVVINNGLGVIRLKTAKVGEAIRYFKKSEKLDPRYLPTLFNLAAAYKARSLRSAALKYYNRLDALQPNNAFILYHRGECYAEMNRDDKAVADYLRVIEIGGGYRVAAYLNAATLYQKHGESGHALTMLDAAILSDPKSFKAYYARALLLFKAFSQPGLALESVEAALGIDPTNVDATHLRAEIRKALS